MLGAEGGVGILRPNARIPRLAGEESSLHRKRDQSHDHHHSSSDDQPKVPIAPHIGLYVVDEPPRRRGVIPKPRKPSIIGPSKLGIRPSANSMAPKHNSDVSRLRHCGSIISPLSTTSKPVSSGG